LIDRWKSVNCIVGLKGALTAISGRVLAGTRVFLVRRGFSVPFILPAESRQVSGECNKTSSQT
jgi:hypothetical protein